MPKLLKSKLVFFIFMAFYSHAILAYNAAGHQLMAAITWDLLNSEQQKYWVDILKHHPRFNQDFKNNIPKYVNRNPKAYNEWIFRQAAIWPDIARGFQPNNKEKYHHGSWHYINYPFYLDGKFNTSFLNLNTNWKHKFHNELNIIQALKGNIEVLSKQGATKSEKALALSWILHLTGDSHQPLHSTALFSENYFKKGDRGGNLVNITGQGRIENLHWFWDSRLNESTEFRIIDLKAKKLSQKHLKLAQNSKKGPIQNWLKNSHKLALKYVYSGSMLKQLKESEIEGSDQPTIFISKSYNQQAKALSETQVVKAGYKMANLLKNLQ